MARHSELDGQRDRPVPSGREHVPRPGTGRVGGVEDYLARIIPALTGAGHRVMLWSEVDAPLDRAPIAGRVDVPRLCAAELGSDEAVAKLQAWCPDVIFAHGLQDPRIERQLLYAQCRMLAKMSKSDDELCEVGR